MRDHVWNLGIWILWNFNSFNTKIPKSNPSAHTLQIGMEVEIRPGIITRDPTTGQCTCRPLRSRIVSLLAEQNQLQFAVPGGLIGVGTLVDPALCRADRLLGMVMSAVGKGPSIFTEIKAEGESGLRFGLLFHIFFLWGARTPFLRFLASLVNSMAIGY